MLFQLHQENAEGETILVSQREFGEGSTPTEYRTWIEEEVKECRLAAGFRWVVHNENSPKFWYTVIQ